MSDELQNIYTYINGVALNTIKYERHTTRFFISELLNNYPINNDTCEYFTNIMNLCFTNDILHDDFIDMFIDTFFITNINVTTHNYNNYHYVMQYYLILLLRSDFDTYTIENTLTRIENTLYRKNYNTYYDMYYLLIADYNENLLIGQDSQDSQDIKKNILRLLLNKCLTSYIRIENNNICEIENILNQMNDKFSLDNVFGFGELVSSVHRSIIIDCDIALKMLLEHYTAELLDKTKTYHELLSRLINIAIIHGSYNCVAFLGRIKKYADEENNNDNYYIHPLELLIANCCGEDTCIVS